MGPTHNMNSVLASRFPHGGIYALNGNGTRFLRITSTEIAEYDTLTFQKYPKVTGMFVKLYLWYREAPNIGRISFFHEGVVRILPNLTIEVYQIPGITTDMRYGFTAQVAMDAAMKRGTLVLSTKLRGEWCIPREVRILGGKHLVLVSEMGIDIYMVEEFVATHTLKWTLSPPSTSKPTSPPRATMAHACCFGDTGVWASCPKPTYSHGPCK